MISCGYPLSIEDDGCIHEIPWNGKSVLKIFWTSQYKKTTVGFGTSIFVLHASTYTGMVKWLRVSAGIELLGPFLWAWAKAREMSLACHPCCRGHAILHDSYALLHFMLCKTSMPWDPWQNVSTLLLAMNLLKNTWEIHRRLNYCHEKKHTSSIVCKCNKGLK